MSESSHTESDSSPPLTVRRRCSGLLDMPRFAISAEDEGATLKRPQSEGMLLSTVQAREGLPVPIPEQPVEHELPQEGDAGATTPSTATGSAPTLAGTCLVSWSPRRLCYLAEINSVKLALGVRGCDSLLPSRYFSVVLWMCLPLK